jgi:hypothetical protein
LSFFVNISNKISPMRVKFVKSVQQKGGEIPGCAACQRCTLIQFSTCLGDLSPLLLLLLLLLLVQREIRKLFPPPRAPKRCSSGRIIPQIDINLKKLSAWRSRPCVSWLFI